MNWKLLPTISAPMPFQMALDELLFGLQKKEIHAPILRFYVSSSPWISAGCSFRDAVALSNSDLILKNPQIPVCRRVTGGGCVLHGQDLIFSLVARYAGGTDLFSSVRTSYEKIHESVRIGLQTCGLDPKFYSNTGKLPKGSDCFDFPVESDLSWKGKKIAGGAQKRSDGVVLHHESILIPPAVEREDLILAIRKGFEQVFTTVIENAQLEPEFYFQVKRQIKTKG